MDVSKRKLVSILIVTILATSFATMGLSLSVFGQASSFTARNIYMEDLAFPYDRTVKYDSTSMYYWSINDDGSIDTTTSTTKATVLQDCLTDLTTSGGSIFLNEIAWDNSLTVPDNVMVIEQLNGTQKKFINSADSQGSPYTISVTGSTNYHAQDAAMSYINSWESTNITTVWENVRDNGLTSGRTGKEKVKILGDVSIDSPLVINVDYVSLDILGSITATENCSIIEVTNVGEIDINGGVLIGESNVSSSSIGLDLTLLNRVQVSGTKIGNCYYGIYLDGCFKTTFENIEIGDDSTVGKCHIGFKTSGSSGRINEPKLNKVIVSAISDGFNFDYANGVMASKCEAVNCGGCGWNFTGETANAIENVILNSIVADTCTGDGLHISKGSASSCGIFQISNYWAKEVADGVELVDANEIHFNNPQIRSVTGHGYYAHKTIGSSVYGGEIVYVGSAKDCINLDSSSEENIFCGLRLETSAGAYFWNEVSAWENQLKDCMIKSGAIGTVSAFSKLENNIGFVTENKVALSGVANGTYVAHGCAGTPDFVTITLGNQGYGWYGTSNSTHTPLYFSTATANGSVDFKYIP